MREEEATYQREEITEADRQFEELAFKARAEEQHQAQVAQQKQRQAARKEALRPKKQARDSEPGQPGGGRCFRNNAN
jgi:hypothetical protein